MLLINRTGNLTDLGKAGSLHEYVLKLHQDYGPIVAFWWAKTYVVSLASPEYWKEVNPIFDRPGRTVVILWLNSWLYIDSYRFSICVQVFVKVLSLIVFFNIVLMLLLCCQ